MQPNRHGKKETSPAAMDHLYSAQKQILTYLQILNIKALLERHFKAQHYSISIKIPGTSIYPH